MKKYEKNNERFKKPGKDNGFTIIETLFSLLLISLALVFMTQVIVTAIRAHQRSTLRFNIQQKIEYSRNQLLAKAFDADEMEEGGYSTADDPLFLKWEIKNISPNLKKIHLSVSFKSFTRKAYFYKSKYIRNNIPGEMKND